MSRRNKQRFAEMEYIPTPVMYGPPRARKLSAADRIMNWIISNDEDGKMAVKELFPASNCNCGICV